MKTFFSAAFSLLISFVVAAQEHVTISTPQMDVSVGSFPEFKFTITGITNSSLADRAQKDSNLTWAGVIVPNLMKDGVYVGRVATGDNTLRQVSPGNFTGSFNWFLTRVLGTNALTTYPPAGRYTIRLGILRKPQSPRTFQAMQEFEFLAETEEFNLLGAPPTLVLHQDSRDGMLWLYSSVAPKEAYTILFSNSAESESPKSWIEWYRFQAPETSEGVFAVGYRYVFHGSGVETGFFRLRHDGPINTPADAELVMKNTDAVGFVGATSLERMGIEASLTNLTMEFKSLKTPAAKKFATD